MWKGLAHCWCSTSVWILFKNQVEQAMGEQGSEQHSFMVSASLPASLYLELLPWFPSIRNLKLEDEINPFLAKLLSITAFTITTEINPFLATLLSITVFTIRTEITAENLVPTAQQFSSLHLSYFPQPQATTTLLLISMGTIFLYSTYESKHVVHDFLCLPYFT